jgi:hypothetical protein
MIVNISELQGSQSSSWVASMTSCAGGIGRIDLPFKQLHAPRIAPIPTHTPCSAADESQMIRSVVSPASRPPASLVPLTRSKRINSLDEQPNN